MCVLVGAAVLTGSPRPAFSGTSVAASQPGLLDALRFKDLTIAASLP
jgi:hypothetical protein